MGEVADRASSDSDARVAGGVVDAKIAKVDVLRWAVAEHAVTVDGVAIEVKGDVVGSDNKPIGGAVDEVVVERRVRGDRCPACQCLAGERWRTTQSDSKE